MGEGRVTVRQMGYGDREHKANAFRSPRADLSEFRKLYGFD